MNGIKNVIVLFSSTLRIFTFVTAVLSNKEVKFFVLHDLCMLLRGIYVDGLAITSLFNSVEFLKNNIDMEFLLFIFSRCSLAFE